MKMKKILYITPVMFLLVLLVKASNPLTIQPQDRSQQATGFSNLTLDITTTKEAFLQLEPIPIILTLSNKKSHAITGHSALNFSDGRIELFVSRVDGEKIKIQNLSPEKAHVRVGPISIEPGETHQSKQLVAMDLDKIFPEPGSYQIEAVLHGIDWEEETKSNPLTIQINQPDGVDSQAFDYIRSEGNPSLFFTGIEMGGSKKAQIALERFVSNFDKSAYGDYASFLLGKFYFYGKEYEKAKMHLDKLAKKTKFIFAEAALDYLDKTNKKLREVSRANN
jgi:hypothetical protein